MSLLKVKSLPLMVKPLDRGSYDDARGLSAIHVVNAFATENGISLRLYTVYEKLNDITAISELS